MGYDVHPMIIVGFRASEVVKEIIKDDTFEVHDERGNKTGESKSVTKTSYQITIDGELKTIDSIEYSEEVAELFGLEEYPNKGKLGVFNTDYDNSGLEKYIVGISVLCVDGMQNETGEVDSEFFNQSMTKVNIFMQKLGVKPNAKIFLSSNGG